MILRLPGIFNRRPMAVTKEESLMVPSFALLAVAGFYVFVQQLRIAAEQREQPE